jgi:hypothetical protein
MCDKCAELDNKIEHYRSLVAKVMDPLTAERVGKLFEDMQAQKAGLHPEQEKNKAASPTASTPGMASRTQEPQAGGAPNQKHDADPAANRERAAIYPASETENPASPENASP